MNKHERKRLISRLKLQRALRQRGANIHPKIFRQVLKVSANETVPFQNLIQPWQEADFAALDPAWLRISGRIITPGSDEEPPIPSAAMKTEEARELERDSQRDLLVRTPIRRAYLERPRGHSKTTDMAVQVAWILQCSRHAVQGLAAAADREQAGLLHRAIAELVRLNPVLCPDLVERQSSIVNRVTGSRLEIISSDVRSSWGHLPDFVICDELCHWEKVDLWYSLISSAAKKPACVLVVLTNAGVGNGWHWDVREAARTSPDWHFSSLVGSQAPWISTAALAEQQRILPASVYARLWDNVWQQTEGEFVTLAEAQACCDAQLSLRDAGLPGQTYVAAIDYAEKQDRTVGVVIHRAGDRIVVDRMDVIAPEPNHPVPVRWVEDWITRISLAFPSVRFVVDEYQLVGTLQKFSARVPMKRFPFSGGKGNHALAMHLRQLIVQRQLAWYPGCGQLPQPTSRDDLETELASLILRTTSSGRVRIDHRRNSNCHDDRAFALGAACLEAIQADPTSEIFEIQQADWGW